MHIRIPLTLAVALIASGCATPFYMGQQFTTRYDRAGDYMPEETRALISMVSIEAGDEAPTLFVGGDYGTPTPTAGDGARDGAKAGVGLTGEMVAEDPRALILVPIVLPIAVIAGSIGGAAAAKIKEQVREFRDDLTDTMLDESDPQLPNAELADELERVVQSVDGVRVADAEPADASLTISLLEVAVIVDGNDAEMSATASVTLQSREDGRHLYSDTFTYRDRDSLHNWTADDNALWRQFTANARQHIARVAAASLFESITTRHVLRPADNDWSLRARKREPVLDWDFALLGGDDYDNTDIAESPIRFDLEVYDGTRLVYAAENIPTSHHTIAEKLPSCRTLSWSVRPVFRINGVTRSGEWMRRASATERMMSNPGVKFSGGRREYWDGFATIRTRC